MVEAQSHDNRGLNICRSQMFCHMSRSFTNNAAVVNGNFACLLSSEEYKCAVICFFHQSFTYSTICCLQKNQASLVFALENSFKTACKAIRFPANSTPVAHRVKCWEDYILRRLPISSTNIWFKVIIQIFFVFIPLALKYNKNVYFWKQLTDRQ